VQSQGVDLGVEGSEFGIQGQELGQGMLLWGGGQTGAGQGQRDRDGTGIPGQTRGKAHAGAGEIDASATTPLSLEPYPVRVPTSNTRHWTADLRLDTESQTLNTQVRHSAEHWAPGIDAAGLEEGKRERVLGAKSRFRSPRTRSR
jgi:hypothetical protein